MDNNKPTSDEKKRELNINKYIPFILGAVILIIAIVGIIQIIRWNKGQEFIIDESVNVDTEPEDFIFFLDPAVAASDSYDGSFDILILGNDTVAYDRGGTNIGEIIEEKTGANVYHCALTGSYMAEHLENEEEDNPLDAFNFFWISDAIQTGDWSRQDAALNNLPATCDRAHYTEVLGTLKSIDYNTIDLLIIYYDGRDYLAKHPINDPTNMYSHHTIEGCFTGSYERYPINYPNMQHMLISPTFCYATLDDGTKEGCDTANLGYGNLPTCMTTLQVQSQTYSVSYVDNYYGININTETADQYLLEDGITPNEQGRQEIAERIAECINIRLND